MTTFAEYATGTTHIRFAVDHSLVLGWMVEFNDPTYGTPTEVRYAMHPDGRVLESEPVAAPNYNFDLPGRKWMPVDAVPDHAEFIGNYIPTMFRGA